MVMGGGGEDDRTKTRRTVTIDEVIDGELRERPLNVSQIVNDLLEEYLIGGDSPAIAKEIRIQHIEKELQEQQNKREAINRRIERLRNERERLEREINEQQAAFRERLEEASEIVEGKPADNPAVQNWAEKLNMDPVELKQRVEELPDD